MESKGFFALLTDFSFDEFVTPKLIKILYALLLLFAVLIVVGGLLSGLVTMFSDSFFAGVAVILGGLIGGLIYAILARVSVELIMVFFKIAQNTTDLVHMKRTEPGP